MRRQSTLEFVIWRSSTGLESPLRNLARLWMYFTLGRPLRRLPSILPVVQVLSNFPSRIMWPRYLSCLCLILLIISLLAPALCNTLSFDVRSTHEYRSILHKNHISAGSILFSITLSMFHASHPCNNIDQTCVFKNLFYKLIKSDVFVGKLLTLLTHLCPPFRFRN